MAKLTELRFRGVDGIDVHHPQARAGHGQPMRFIGKAWDKDAEAFVPSSEPDTLRLTAGELVACRALLANACKAAQLVPADKATADALGLPFSAPASSAPKAAQKGDA